MPPPKAGVIRPRVMLVEDHPLIQDVIQKLLATEYDVIAIVEHGDEVLVTAQQLLPDLVTLDISLPGRSGMQILPELRATLPGVGIVMVTTQVDALYKDEALALGADGFVAKARVGMDLLPALRAAQVVDRSNVRRRA